MRSLLLGALVVGVLAACGGSANGTTTTTTAGERTTKTAEASAPTPSCDELGDNDVVCEESARVSLLIQQEMEIPGSDVPFMSVIETSPDGGEALLMLGGTALCGIQPNTSILTRYPDGFLFTQRWGITVCYSNESEFMTIPDAALVEFDGEMKVDYIPGEFLWITFCDGTGVVQLNERLFPSVEQFVFELPENSSLLAIIDDQTVNDEQLPNVSEAEEAMFERNRTPFAAERSVLCARAGS